MSNDPITEEIRTIRRNSSAQFGNDISRILADAREREASDERKYVRLPKRLTSRRLADQADEREPE